MAIKVYSTNYKQMIEKIFETKQHFFNTFGGGLQTAEGAEYNEDFMKIKVSPTNVVINKYDMGENVAFGTGTGNSNRFGPRQEIKSLDKTVPYDEPIAIHEGIDRFTVNDIPEQVLAERAALHAEKWIEYINQYLSKLLDTNAGETKQVALTEDALIKLFFEARKTFVNKKVSTARAWNAYVTPDVYNILIDSKLTTNAKNSSANVDEQTLNKFKGFILRELPEEYFQKNTQAIFVPDNIGVVGLGIETYRTIDSADFNGIAIQGAGKLANYIPDDNKVAIIKAQIAG